MRIILFLTGLFYLLSGVSSALDFQMPRDLKAKFIKTSCQINVTNPTIQTWCYINQVCPVIWDTSNMPSGGSVFLHVIQVDAEHPSGWEGGGYPVPNTGNYQWIVPENVGPLDGSAFYVIKVITPDQKCSGLSEGFGIKRKLEFPKIPTPLKK